jgi:DNA topoisomerase I
MKSARVKRINAGKRRLLSTDPVDSARTAGLRYVSDLAPGIRRKRRGSGFIYFDASKRRLRNRQQLRRIKRLAIPPAWKDVWISSREDGHLQATGRDAKGRKQYRYHEDWRAVRDETKYDRLIAFAETLSKIRKRVEADLRKPSLTREKVLATVVQLLQISLIRVGNEEYAQANHSFGLTTMRNRHAQVVGPIIRFHFKGKSGKIHELKVSDRRLARITKRCQELPGQHLFEYLNDEGRAIPVHSEDVNEYLRTISGQEFTAKDFRTWTGTVLAAIALHKMEEVGSKKPARQNVVRAVESVAKALGNTPAICRKCYVHPVIIDSYMNGALANSLRLKADAELSDRLNELRPAEAAILAFLRDEMEKRAKKKPQDLTTVLTKSLARLDKKRKPRSV